MIFMDDSRRHFLKVACIGAAALFIGGPVGADDAVKGKSAYVAGSSLSARLDPETPYLLLLDHKNFRIVNDIEKILGMPGAYGHIEVIYDNSVFGCRPPECSERKLSDLEKHFRGAKYRVVQPPFDGDPALGVKHFRDNIAGAEYDFRGFEMHDSWDVPNFNCTDLVNILHDRSGNNIRSVRGVDVDMAYRHNKRLRELMDRNKITVPNRKVVYFPDEYMNIGKIIEEGNF
jgi:hypothetical protein